MKQVTVYDIAKEAKVSVATVSRVINGTAPVKHTTKTKIQRIIDKYQFQPSAIARSLLKKETGVIGMIMPDISNPFFPEVFAGAEREARALGRTIFLGTTMGDPIRESEYLSVMREKQVDGLLFMGGRVNLKRCDPSLVKEVVEQSTRLPVVIINGQLPHRGLYRVSTDEYAGAELAVKHLVELGHTEIGFLGGHRDYYTTSIKVKAFRKVLKEHGLPFKKEWVLFDSFSVDSGRQLMKQLLELDSRPTAICCINDFTAIGAVKAAQERGFRIPQDISIVGYDDSPLASVITPELTTISQNAAELGGEGVVILNRLIAKERGVRLSTTLKPKLVIRQSTGPV